MSYGPYDPGLDFCHEQNFFSPKRPNQTNVLLIVAGGSCPGVKQPEREVDYSSASSANVNNKWSWSSLYAFLEWTEIHLILFLPLTYRVN